jgi:S-(hydroxymethyl)glutathione dehydrogenase / alcohol dehydrogenase
VGIPRMDVMLNLNAALTFLYSAKTVKGCWYGSSNVREDVPKLIELYKPGQLKLEELVSRKIGREGVKDNPRVPVVRLARRSPGPGR